MNRPPILISPSLLAADFGALASEIQRVETAGADELHLDIMDACFVRNLSMGPDMVRMARRTSAGLRLSVHLMMMRPADYIDVFADAGAGTLLIHIEAQADHAALLHRIRSHGIRAGLTLNPETPAARVQPFLQSVDEILVMSVHPGFGGQGFIRGVLPKIARLRAWSDARQTPFDISVDGGIGLDTVAEPVAAGANLLIAGTALFRAADMTAATQTLRAAALQAQSCTVPTP